MVPRGLRKEPAKDVNRLPLPLAEPVVEAGKVFLCFGVGKTDPPPVTPRHGDEVSPERINRLPEEPA
jgi:hypothetical protein